MSEEGRGLRRGANTVRIPSIHIYTLYTFRYRINGQIAQESILHCVKSLKHVFPE